MPKDVTIELASSEQDIKASAAIMDERFHWSYHNNEAYEDLQSIISGDGLLLIAKLNNTVVGLIGAVPQYGTTGWELHPLAVKQSHEGKGIATTLLETLELLLVKMGCHVVYLGTDDERFQTSLSQSDLFENTLDKIEGITNLDNHPYTFYQRHGYKIVGVIPDANGPNKPDIIMAKRLLPYPS